MRGRLFENNFFMIDNISVQNIFSLIEHFIVLTLILLNPIFGHHLVEVKLVFIYLICLRPNWYQITSNIKRSLLDALLQQSSFLRPLFLSFFNFINISKSVAIYTINILLNLAKTFREIVF